MDLARDKQALDVRDRFWVGLAGLDRDGRMTSANAALLRLLDAPLSAVSGRRLSDLLLVPAARGWTPMFFRAQPVGAEGRAVVDGPDGSRLRIEWVRTAWEGSCYSVFVGPELEPMDDAAFYRDLFDHFPMALCLTDGDRVVLANRTAALMSGRDDPSELVGMSVYAMHPPHRWSASQRRGDSLLKEGQSVPPLVYKFTRPNGEEVHVETSAWPIRYQGRPGGLIIGQDVTDRQLAEEARETVEEHLRALLENASNFVVYRLALDLTRPYLGRVVFVSPSITHIMGVEEPFRFESWFENVHPEDLDRVVEANQRGTETGYINTVFRVWVAAKSQWRHLQAIATAIHDEKENQSYANGLILDITDQMRANSKLAESERTAQALLDAAPDMMVLCDDRGEVLAANEPGGRLLGRAVPDLIGQNVLACASPERAVLWRHYFEQAQSAGRSQSWEERRDDRRFRYWLHPVFDQGGNVFRMALVVRDLTDRWLAESKIMSYQERLRRMGAELLLAEERERRRIATNLHDHIGQTLILIKFKLRTLTNGRSIRDDIRPAQETCQLIDQMILDVRSLTLELSPPILYELGLEAALEWLTERIEAEYGVNAWFFDDGRDKPLDEDVRILLFRAVQELLVNVVKHARAEQVRVSVQKKVDRIVIEVEDDGVGFDFESESTSTAALSQRGFGLFSVRERLNTLGGRLEVRSTIGAGATVRLTAALKKEGLGDGAHHFGR